MMQTVNPCFSHLAMNIDMNFDIIVNVVSLFSMINW